jgi:hypothetical protein
MTMFRGGFSNLLAPGYRKVVFETYKERPNEGRQFVNSGTSRRAYEEDFQLAGFGTLLPKVEGGPIMYQDIKQGEPKRYLWTTYALGYRITQEMYEDELYGIMGNKLARALGRSARNNEEIVMHSILNNAFNTTYSGFVAGESLLGAHTSLRGLAQRNRPAVDVDFSLPALQAALEHFHGLTDESGLPAMYQPKYLVHSIGDYWMVNQVLKSQFLPGGSQNDINQVAREGIVPILSHFLTDPDAWYLIADNHDMNYYNRRPFTFSNTDDFQTGDALYKGTRRNGAGFGDWRGIYGSSGA